MARGAEKLKQLEISSKRRFWNWSQVDTAAALTLPPPFSELFKLRSFLSSIPPIHGMKTALVLSLVLFVGDGIQLQVLAHWQDGTIEDVTQITRFRTNDESVAEVSATGLVTSTEKGDTHIVAFYDNGVQPVPAMLAASQFTGAKFPKVPTRTKVDELVVNKLRKAGIVPSEVCTDAEFLRRVSLDMTATLPTPEEVRVFLADKSADKRAKKIEALLASPGYAAWWTTLLCDFSDNNPRQLNTGGELQINDKFSRQWYDWILKRVADIRRSTGASSRRKSSAAMR